MLIPWLIYTTAFIRENNKFCSYDFQYYKENYPALLTYNIDDDLKDTNLNFLLVFPWKKSQRRKSLKRKGKFV